MAGLLLLETLSIGLFALLLVRQQEHRLYLRAEQTLAYQSTSLAMQSADAFGRNRPSWIEHYIIVLVSSPTVEATKISDRAGYVLFFDADSSDSGGQGKLRPDERAQIALMRDRGPRLFIGANDRWEAVHAIYVGNELRGHAWVTYDRKSARISISCLGISQSSASFGWLPRWRWCCWWGGRSLGR